MDLHLSSRCQSIKSRKHPDLQCPNKVNSEGWCSKHIHSRVKWIPRSPSLLISDSQQIPPHLTLKKQEQNKKEEIQKKNAALKIHRFWKSYGRYFLRREKGICTYFPEFAHNDKDIYSYEPVTSIPLTYRFSYIDSHHNAWIFDLRFLLHLIQYGNELKNPFTQEPIPSSVIERLQKRAAKLRIQNIPIVYIDSSQLTPEQIWNQKVLDVFLKFTALGYGVNVLWYETMTKQSHERFYTKLYELWNLTLRLTEADKEKIVPGHSSSIPLFRWNPLAICGREFDLKWWRKTNLGLMRAFLTRAQDKTTQGCGALYLLTALANVHPQCAQAFPWLVQE